MAKAKRSATTLRATYDRIAEDYYYDHVGDTWENDHLQLFVNMVPKGGKVLDLGCGPGTEIVKLRAAGFEVYGFDLSPKLLAIAQKNNPGVDLKQGDMRKLPYRDHFFDGVFAKASLLHIPKQEIHLVVNEILRVLKPHGIVHISVKKRQPHGPEEEEKTEDDYGYAYTRYFSYWDAEELKKTLSQHGFNVEHFTETTKPGGRTTWLKVIAKKT